MMTNQTVLTIAQEALQITVLVSAPMLLTALVVGLVVSVFQAATQINEMTLSFIPKLLAMFAVLVVSGPWILSMLVDYMQRLYTSIPQTIG
jgi:flagellar biosynthesis protein FliQ